MVYGVVVAGGQGSRLGEKKQYRCLAGRPMWERSIRALQTGGFNQVWLVVPPSDVDKLQSEIKTTGMRDRVYVVAGGATRFASVRAGLAAVFAESASDDLWIGIHDAARPFVSTDDVKAVVQAAQQSGAAILAQPCPDTVKRVQSGMVEETVPRTELWLAQTPQVFRADWMRAAYWANPDWDQVTDDASVMELAGYPVKVVTATGENRKITTKADLEYAECLAEMRWGGERSS